MYDYNGIGHTATVTDNRGIVGPFRWAAYPTGGTVHLQFSAIPSQSQLYDLKRFVLLKWGQTPVAFGPIMYMHPQNATDVREYHVGAGRDIMRMRVVPPMSLSGTATSVLNALLLYRDVEVPGSPIMTATAPPILENIPDVQLSVNITKPTTIYDALNSITGALGLAWDVLPRWEITIWIGPARKRAKLNLSDAEIRWIGTNRDGIPNVIAVYHEIAMQGTEIYDPLVQSPFPSGRPPIPWARRDVWVLWPGQDTRIETLQNVPLKSIQSTGGTIPWGVDTRVFSNAYVDFPQMPYTLTIRPFASGAGAESTVLWLQFANINGTVRGAPIYVPANGQVQTIAAGRYAWSEKAFENPTRMYLTVGYPSAPSTSVQLISATAIDVAQIDKLLTDAYEPIVNNPGIEVIYRRYVPPPAPICVIPRPNYATDIVAAIDVAEYEISTDNGIISKLRFSRSLNLTRALIERAIQDAAANSVTVEVL